jgi:hypothetical protein
MSMEPITLQESARLRFIVDRVKANEATILETAQLLKELRDKRLYRSEAATFEQFCKQTFDICRSRGYQLICFAEEVEMSTKVDTAPPKTEREARERKASRKPICDAPAITPAPVVDVPHDAVAEAKAILEPACRDMDEGPVRELSDFEREVYDQLDVVAADISYVRECIAGRSCDPDELNAAALNFSLTVKMLHRLAKSCRL